MNNDKISFECGRIKQVRLTNGLSVKAFAKGCGISRPHLKNIEEGDCSPGVEILLSIANAYNVPIDYFFVKNNVTYTGIEPCSLKQ